jgi:beta-lactamase class D
VSRVERAAPQCRPLLARRPANVARCRAGARRIGVFAVALGAVGLVACARSIGPEPSPAHPVSSQAPAPTPACFLLYEKGVGEIRRSPAEACASRLSPNSTFKIAHALAALDSGVLSGKDHKLLYDGTPVDFSSHGRDHTLTSAVHDSVVWYFQRVATMLGKERERAYLEMLDYGNRDPSSGLTTFWLDGSLRISPEEQAGFMVRLYQDALPVDKRAMRAVREILIQPQGSVVNATGAHPFAAPWPEGTILSAKTGRGSETRWVVGHVARASRSWVFVSAVVGATDANPLAAVELAAASLRSAGVL